MSFSSKRFLVVLHKQLKQIDSGNLTSITACWCFE